MKTANDKNETVAAPIAPPENSAATNPRDARKDKEKMKQNRKKLGVEEDHKTQDMEKSNRGTFP